MPRPASIAAGQSKQREAKAFAEGMQLPSEAFAKATVEELSELHVELTSLMRRVALIEHADNERGTFIVLAPSPTQRAAAELLLDRYRDWFERVRPFLERSAPSNVAAFDEAFAVLSTYFSLRRVGAGVSEPIWRELFCVESGEVIRQQLLLLGDSRQCFGLLDPRPRRRFEDLALRISSTGSNYRVSAHSGRGEAGAAMEFPFDERDIENFMLRWCDPHRDAVRGWTPPSLAPYVEFGQTLFEALFSGDVRDLYMKHRAEVDHGRVRLRISLSVTEAPRLAEVPWEYCYDGSDFLLLTGTTSLTRRFDAARRLRPLRVNGPLRIAVTASAPADQGTLDVPAEISGLRAALAPLVSADLAQITLAQDGTLATLASMLRDAERIGQPFHVWHFLGHGNYSPVDGGASLAFETENGGTRMQSGFDLGTLLNGHPSLRLAILNACDGGRGAPENPTASVAAGLIEHGLPACVAMQFPITDTAAVAFGSEIYRGLVEGDSIDAAICDARRSIFFSANQSEWATPVLFLRSQDGALFNPARPGRRSER